MSTGEANIADSTVIFVQAMRTLSLLAACISFACSTKLHGVDVPPIKGAILFYSDGGSTASVSALARIAIL